MSFHKIPIESIDKTLQAPSICCCNRTREYQDKCFYPDHVDFGRFKLNLKASEYQYP